MTENTEVLDAGCGEAGCEAGCCGNASCLPGVTKGKTMSDLHPLDALLPEICQLLDTCREDFMQRGLWTEWDQSVRDRITAYNLSRIAARTPEPRFLEGYTLGCGLDEGKGSIYD